MKMCIYATWKWSHSRDTLVEEFRREISSDLPQEEIGRHMAEFLQKLYGQHKDLRNAEFVIHVTFED